LQKVSKGGFFLDYQALLILDFVMLFFLLEVGGLLQVGANLLALLF
jgi:hypothetical protein